MIKNNSNWEEAKWISAPPPSSLSVNELKSYSELILDTTGELYTLQALKEIPADINLGSVKLDYKGQLSGLLWISLVNHCRARILIFVIKESLCGIGLGTKAWNLAYHSLVKSNISIVQLEVMKSNYDARRFYLKKGFSEISQIKQYYSHEDGILMERMLP